MPTMTAQDFDQELLILFDAYVHGDIDRRRFLVGAQKFATASMTAVMLLAALSPKFAQAQKVKADDTRLETKYLHYSSVAGYGSVKAYLARPAKSPAPLPAILVVHENRGLNPHIEDIARRLALAGFMAFAPDALTPLGGYPGDEDRARELFAKLDQNKTQQDFLAAAHYLKTRADCNGKLGAVGFCYGGGVVHMLSFRSPDLDVAVTFYGNHPAPENAAQVKTALQIHLAGMDERINASWPAYEAALKVAGVKYSAFQYPGTQHGFNNDTTPRFDAPSAELAWQRTLAFFQQTIKG